MTTVANILPKGTKSSSAATIIFIIPVYRTYAGVCHPELASGSFTHATDGETSLPWRQARVRHDALNRNCVCKYCGLLHMQVKTNHSIAVIDVFDFYNTTSAAGLT